MGITQDKQFTSLHIFAKTVEINMILPVFQYQRTVNHFTFVLLCHKKERMVDVYKRQGQGYVCPISLPAYQAAEKGFEIAFGKKPLAVRRGGSIPIISTFEQVLGTKTVLMGFGLESDAIHSPNENFSLDIFRKGIEAVIEFHQEYAKR